MQVEREKILEAMRNALPPYFRIAEQKILSKKTVYNLISQGRGPSVTSIGGKNFLERDSFIEWASQRGSSLHRPGRKRAVKGGTEQK
jgi:homoserine kinase